MSFQLNGGVPFFSENHLHPVRQRMTRTKPSGQNVVLGISPMPMLRESYEQEVMRLALGIVAKCADSRGACAAECDQVVEQILARLLHREERQQPNSLTLRSSDRQSGAVTDTSAAYAMLVAVGVFSALKAQDDTLTSVAYEFHQALERRAQLVR